jgi:prepilin-type N-terminal cleavage/methylation domain-containing protein
MLDFFAILKSVRARKARSNYRITKAGFTLVELAIVLVIIGLVVGGVLVGKDLIRAAENRSFVGQLETYNAAANTFKTKYNCVPGDCPTATAYGFSNNGNGNGMVSGLTASNTYSVDYNLNGDGNPGVSSYVIMYLGWTNFHESNYFWDHLSAAHLVANIGTPPSIADGVGTNYYMPLAKNDGTGIVVTGWGGKHYFQSGIQGIRGGGGAIFYNNFSPVDAAYIFEKMGGTTITTTSNNADLYPDGLGKERVIISGGHTTNIWGYNGIWYDLAFYRHQSQGAGGANSNVCINTSLTPAYFNLKNPNKLCSLIIQTGF